MIALGSTSAEGRCSRPVAVTLTHQPWCVAQMMPLREQPPLQQRPVLATLELNSLLHCSDAMKRQLLPCSAVIQTPWGPLEPMSPRSTLLHRARVHSTLPFDCRQAMHCWLLSWRWILPRRRSRT